MSGIQDQGMVDPEGACPFVQIGPRDNFYQSAAFIPMSFALVTTTSETGETGLGPHALCYPFSVSAPYSMLLISRGSSATASNIRRTGRCALNYIEFDREKLRAIARLGYPGQPPEEKREANPFALIPSPATDRADRPLIVAEAFQVIECTWDNNIDLGPQTTHEREHGASRFVLGVDRILLRHDLRQGSVDGSIFPRMPIFYGFRAGGDFWFAEHGAPFAVAAPQASESSLQAAQYLATRLDDTIRFTEDATRDLARIPRPFLTKAMQGLVDKARHEGITEINSGFLRKVRQDNQAD